MTAHFDLLTEPWIPVRYTDGRVTDVSIRQAFDDADSIREIAGELPTQTFALTRLLLAILYRATYNDIDNRWDDEWDDWRTGGLPLEDVHAYLDDYDDRFDLLHPTRPFFQVAELHTASGEVKDTSALIFDVGMRGLFSTRSGAASLRLPYAEAARWLVNAQAFDASGIKSGAVGDSRVKGGKGYPIGVAWSGLLGGVLLEGTTLFESLLFNFAVPGVDGIEGDGRTDLPAWEDEEPDTAAERAGLLPTGPVRLFTWQSRRIRLVAEDGQIVACVLANGDVLTPQNRQRHEPHTAWRYSDPQTKKAKRLTYMPREHLPGRAFWRGIGAILPASALTRQTKDKVDAALPPAILTATRRRQAVHGRRLGLRAIGVVYGSNNSVVDEVIDDRITVALALLQDQHPELALAAQLAAESAEQGVRALRYLAENLSRAAGGPGEGPQLRAEAAGYAQLDRAYREWLAQLDEGVDLEQLRLDWYRTADATIREIGNGLIRDAGPAAWIGREVQGNLMNTSRAEQRFRSALRNTFGNTSGTAESQPDSAEAVHDDKESDA